VKILARLLLVAALLFAQTSGVAHELWHASSLATHGDGDSKAPKGNPLCDFHTALSAVLGAVDGGSHAGSPEVQPAVAFAGVDVAVTGRSSLTPRSRGPPTLL
jgi:hypothetical protein